MLEGLIFDVDGTVAETEHMHLRAFNLAFAKHRLDMAWDVAGYRRLLRVAGGKERIAVALAQRGMPRAPAEIEAMHASKTNFYAMMVAAETVPWRPGVQRVMEEAWSTGRSVALATTTSDENLDPLFVPVMGMAWRARFAAVVTGTMVARKKPAPDAYLEALRRMGTPASRAVAFEDSANGVMAASSAGLAVVATPSAWLTEDEFSGADMLLEQGLHDLPSIQFLASWHCDRGAACKLRA